MYKTTVIMRMKPVNTFCWNYTYAGRNLLLLLINDHRKVSMSMKCEMFNYIAFYSIIGEFWIRC